MRGKYSNIRKYSKIFENIRKYLKIFENIWIYSNIRLYTARNRFNLSNIFRWEIQRLVGNKTVAFTNSTSDYPFGVHKWYFAEEFHCSDAGYKWRKLIFHQEVKQPGNFCCDDGNCIREALNIYIFIYLNFFICIHFVLMLKTFPNIFGRPISIFLKIFGGFYFIVLNMFATIINIVRIIQMSLIVKIL